MGSDSNGQKLFVCACVFKCAWISVYSCRGQRLMLTTLLNALLLEFWGQCLSMNLRIAGSTWLVTQWGGHRHYRSVLLDPAFWHCCQVLNSSPHSRTTNVLEHWLGLSSRSTHLCPRELGFKALSTTPGWDTCFFCWNPDSDSSLFLWLPTLQRAEAHWAVHFRQVQPMECGYTTVEL